MITDDQIKLMIGSLLHDIGKLCIEVGMEEITVRVDMSI